MGCGVSSSPQEVAKIRQELSKVNAENARLRSQVASLQRQLAETTQKRAVVPTSGNIEVHGLWSETADNVDTQKVSASPCPQEIGSAYSYSVAGNMHSKEDIGACMLCLEPLPNDPREVVNLCSNEPRCLCLLHRRCYLNPQYEMSDQLRRCMICKKMADPALVRLAVKVRQNR